MALRFHEAVAVVAAAAAVRVFFPLLCYTFYRHEGNKNRLIASTCKPMCDAHCCTHPSELNAVCVSLVHTRSLSQHRQKANNNIRLNKFIVRCCSPSCSRAAHSTHAHTSIFLENTDLSKPRWGRQALLVWLVCACNDLFRAHAENKATTATVRLCNQ